MSRNDEATPQAGKTWRQCKFRYLDRSRCIGEDGHDGNHSPPAPSPDKQTERCFASFREGPRWDVPGQCELPVGHYGPHSDHAHNIPAPPATSSAGERDWWKYFNDRVRNKVEGQYGPFTNADWQAACDANAALAEKDAALKKAEAAVLRSEVAEANAREDADRHRLDNARLQSQMETVLNEPGYNAQKARADWLQEENDRLKKELENVRR